MARVAALCSNRRMDIATLTAENASLKVLLAQTQAQLADYQAALAEAEEARRRRQDAFTQPR